MNLREITSYDWLTVSIILILVCIIILKNVNIIKFTLFAKLAYSDTYFKHKDKENRFFSSFEIVAILIAHIIVALFLYFIVKDFEFVSDLYFSPFMKLAIIFFTVSFFSFLKYQLEKLVNLCLTDNKMLSYYQVYKQIIWSYAIYLSLPFLIISAYSPLKKEVFLYAGLAIVGTYYVLKILLLIYKNRNLFIGNWYYFILYLCTLEIAPYFFLYKILGVQ